VVVVCVHHPLAGATDHRCADAPFACVHMFALCACVYVRVPVPRGVARKSSCSSHPLPCVPLPANC
jgi:hypothetical protein